MSELTPAARALQRGVSLTQMSETSGRKRGTLNTWFYNDRKMFEAIIDATLKRRQDAAKAGANE